VTVIDTPTSELSRFARTGSILTIVSGVVALVLGILVVVWPQTSALVVAVLFGLQLLISGIIRVVTGATDKSMEGW